MAARRRSLGKRPSCSCSEADCWFGVVGDGSGCSTSSGVVYDSGPSWSRERTRNRLLVGTAGIVFGSSGSLKDEGYECSRWEGRRVLLW